MKVSWSGILKGIQPRIRLMRSFDERAHTYLGYILQIRGELEDDNREFIVAIGKKAQEKHRFQAGDKIAGSSHPVADERLEVAEYYKTSALRLLERNASATESSPPLYGEAPSLEKYRERGHRRLAARTYDTKCKYCIWGCRMPVEMIIDQWNPSNKKYRFETFCYGPKSCSNYASGPTRKVPGRRGMTWEEEDWIDVESTAHRGDDE